MWDSAEVHDLRQQTPEDDEDEDSDSSAAVPNKRPSRGRKPKRNPRQQQQNKQVGLHCLKPGPCTLCTCCFQSVNEPVFAAAPAPAAAASCVTGTSTSTNMGLQRGMHPAQLLTPAAAAAAAIVQKHAQVCLRGHAGPAPGTGQAPAGMQRLMGSDLNHW